VPQSTASSVPPAQVIGQAFVALPRGFHPLLVVLYFVQGLTRREEFGISFPELAGGFIPHVTLAQHQAKVVMRLRGSGLQLDGHTKLHARLRQISLLEIDRSRRIMRQRVVRLDVERGAELSRRFFPISLLRLERHPRAYSYY
jgi:hypothetical protein